MIRLLKNVFLITALCLMASQAEAAKAVLDVGLNRAELIELDKPMTEVMIANPEIADVVVHGAQKISVIGKKIGTTNIRFFDDKANVINEVDIVVGYDLASIRRALKRFFPNQNIGIETINNSIAVSGVVPDAQTSNRVMQVVYEFVKETRIDEAEGGGGANQRYTDQDNRFPGIVNLLSLNSGQQVMLKVRIGEVRREALKDLGFSLQGLSEGGSSLFQFATNAGNALFSPASTLTNGATSNNGVTGRVGGFQGGVANPYIQGAAGFTHGRFSAAAAFQALETEGLAKIIAEPNLTTVSGETANFLAGGEFPIVTTTGLGTSDTTFQQFGVSLAFTPFVLANNRIRLVVAPEYSEIDATLTAASGTSQGVPGLTTRRAKTTVELAPGESFMIAGLIRDELNSSINEVPGLAEVPIISALLRSTNYQREETELVIAVTPYIVDPVVNSEIRLPTDEFRTPSVMEMVFYGALGQLSHGQAKIGQTPVLEGPIGFMMD